MSKLISASVITGLLVLTGCAVKEYEGPERPRSEIVVLKDGGTEYHYLPGKITFGRPDPHASESLAFEGRAGHTYTVMYWQSLDYINGEAWIVEDATGSQVSERIRWGESTWRLSQP